MRADVANGRGHPGRHLPPTRVGSLLWGTLLLCAAARPAAASGGLDLRTWLDRPGVRLVAVEFYATWCKPCMEAVPEWKELHEQYRDRGLRLVVVSTQDPEGMCVNPGWNPDEIVCDPDGHLAGAMRVGSRLPAAFLWSWQGNLLVRRGHVDAVREQVARYLRETPRVLIEARNARGRPSKGLRELLRDELAQQGKLEVVAFREEQAALRALRKQSHALSADEALACEVGREVPANALLRGSVSGPKGGRRLHLVLLSAESGCLLASAATPWPGRERGRSVAEAVHRLVSRLRRPLQLPGAPQPEETPAPEPKRPPEPAVQAAPPAAPAVRAAHLVRLESWPAGAWVYVDGVQACQTPCARELPAGGHAVSVRKPGHRPVETRLEVAAGAALRVRLEPLVGWLTVHSQPPGCAVTVDGEAVGRTPLVRRPVAPGSHDVEVSASGYAEAGQRVEVVDGREATLSLVLRPVPGALQVRVAGADGRPVPAPVLVDGVLVGTTPWIGEVPAGAHEVLVAGQRRQVTVAAGQTADVLVRVGGEPRPASRATGHAPGTGAPRRAPPVAAPPPDGEGGRSWAPAVVAYGMAAASLTAGLVLLAADAEQRRALDEAVRAYNAYIDSDQLLDKGRRMELADDVSEADYELAARDERLLGLVGLGLAAAAAGVGTWLLGAGADGEGGPSAAGLGVAPQAGGAQVRVWHSF